VEHDDTYTEGTYRLFQYRNYGDHVVITDLTDAPAAVLTIPSEIDGVPVTTIGTYAIKAWITLEKVVLPDTITTIEDYAFLHSFMSSIELPDSVTSIGKNAFSSCENLQEITLPENLTSIGDHAFRSCSNLSSVTCRAEHLESVGESILSGTAWYDAQPDGLITLGNVAYTYKGEMPADTALTLDDGITSIAGDAFYCKSNLVSVSLPQQLQSIGDYAFSGCTGLTAVNFPQQLQSIGESAFSSCKSLTEVALPASLTTYGTNVFSGCTNLSAIVPDPENPYFSQKDGVLYDKTFHTVIEVPYGITSCEIADTVTTIPESVFSYHQKLERVVLPDSVTEIGELAFASCSQLQEVVLSEHLTSIGRMAFIECTALETLDMPNTVTELGTAAFGLCTSLKTLKFSTGISEVHAEVVYIEFASDDDATEEPLPYDDNTDYGDTALYISPFYGCTQLRDVYYDGSREDWSAIQFDTGGDTELLSATIHFGNVITMTDMLRMQKQMTGILVSDSDEYDLNGDGTVNIFDLILMKQALLRK
jgi:hypothetical protein